MSLVLHSLRLVFLDILGDFVYFPFWWYTVGFWQMFKKCWLSLLERQRDLAIDIWLKNLFVPMYGQHDFAGRVISFFMRSVQIIGRSFIFLIWLILLAAFLSLWLIVPMGIIYQILLTF